MKKKVIIITLVALLFGSGVTYAAANNYYSKLLAGQQGQMKDIIEEKYDERSSEVGEQVHHDMVMFVSTERDRILKEAQAYLKTKMDMDQKERMNEHSQAIQDESERILRELKLKIDELTEGE
ncbi:hypothetical protein ACFQ3N_01665 [Virgibacillus byunsanensis]|uniref:Uncharacterized protein n=1 Tax=Virgibacillus byunsanensis TaxID=570945 RepID=A0ABW3LIM1_9BACI